MRLIDADKFEVIGGKVPEGYDADSYLAGCKEILEMIDTAPAIDAEPVRHGRWEFYPNASVAGRDVWVCSECETGYSWVAYHNYCPNCGARMDGGKGE